MIRCLRDEEEAPMRGRKVKCRQYAMKEVHERSRCMHQKKIMTKVFMLKMRTAGSLSFFCTFSKNRNGVLLKFFERGLEIGNLELSWTVQVWLSEVKSLTSECDFEQSYTFSARTSSVFFCLRNFVV